MNHEKKEADERPEPWGFPQLVEQARAGDLVAIDQLVSQWRNYLLLIANQDLDQELQPKVAPSDMVQQSLLDVQQHIVDFRGSSEAEFRAWVRQILRNNIQTARRRFKTAKQRDLNREIDIDDSGNPPLLHAEDSPSAAALNLERESVLESAMQKLPKHYRQVIQLRNWEELTFVEIAKRMDSTEDSVRKLWARALLRIQQEIAQEFPDFNSGVEPIPTDHDQ